MKSCYSGLAGVLPWLLGKGGGGRGLTAEFNPGQVLGGLLEETGLGVEEELGGVDVDHFLSAVEG